MLYSRLFSILGIITAVVAGPTPQAKGKGLGKGAKGAKGPRPIGVSSEGCSKFEMIVARGSTETPPYGALAGKPLVERVEKAVPGAKGYGVNYPASLSFTTSVPKGVADIIKRLNGQNKACPDQKFALVGYSQGGTIMHMALGSSTLDKSVFPKILAIVLFGDAGFKGKYDITSGPAIPPELRSKVRENCNHKDIACDPSGGDLAHHLKYGGDPWQKDSTAFIVAAFEGKPLPKAVTLASDPAWKAQAR